MRSRDIAVSSLQGGTPSSPPGKRNAAKYSATKYRRIAFRNEVEFLSGQRGNEPSIADAGWRCAGDFPPDLTPEQYAALLERVKKPNTIAELRREMTKAAKDWKRKVEFSVEP